MYVHYLNKPKRAKLYKHVEDDDFPHPNLIIPNNNKEIYRRQRRKYVQFMDKTNLSEELDYKIAQTRGKMARCGCSYRNKFCRQHISYLLCSTYPSKYISSNKYNKSRKISSGHDIYKHKHLHNHGFHHRRLPSKHNTFKPLKNGNFTNKLSFKNLLLKHHSFEYEARKRAVFRQTHNFHNKSRLLLHQRIINKKEDRFVKASTALLHFETDALCLCKTLPNTESRATLNSYKRDCNIFYFRKLLAICLTSTFFQPTLKSFDHCKSHTRPATIPRSLHETISSWCAHFTRYCIKDTEINPADQPALGMRPTHHAVLPYCYFNKTRISSLKSSASEQDEEYFNSFEKLPSQNFLAQDVRNIKVSKIDASCLPSMQSHVSDNQDYTLNCSEMTACTSFNDNSDKMSSICHNGDSEFPGDENLAVKRISSRLKMKRDSGVQGPYHEDFLVEIPTLKKPKKVKLNHSYSNVLFWNFYYGFKIKKKYDWLRMYKLYIQLGNPTTIDQSYPLQHCDDDEPCKDERYNQGLRGGTSCQYCSLPFHNFTDGEKKSHDLRHRDIRWHNFTYPVLLPLKLVVKNVKKSFAKNKITLTAEPENKKPPQLTNEITVKSPKKPSPFFSFKRHNRATARKSGLYS